uniref:Zinc finger protein 91 n=2 Tax=Culex pipiens TaxID=7175 RepID=A0A8D8GBN5_CULPI
MQLEYDSKQIMDNFPSTCRFCLSREDCVPILNDGGEIADHLLLATDFILSKVDESDGLPNSICQRCLKCVIEFAALEARCQQTYEILQQILEEQATTHDEVPFEAKVEEFDVEEDCAVVYLEDDSSEQELLKAPVVKAQPPTAKKGKQCPICGKFVSQLSKHMPAHSDLKRHSCPHCEKRFAHDTTLREHINSVHLRLKKYHCEREGCSEAFTNRSSLRYHDTVKHRNARDFVCAECGKSYHTSTGLSQHTSLSHDQRRFRCDECGKMFAMKYHLKTHMLTHTEARPFSCELCDRTFKQMKNLNEHLVVVHAKPRIRKQ